MTEDKDIEDLLDITLHDMYWIYAQHIGNGAFSMTVGPIEVVVTRDEVMAARMDCKMFFDLVRGRIEDKLK